MQSAEASPNIETTTIDRALLVAARTAVFLVLAMPLVITPDTIYPFVIGKALYSRVLIEIAFATWAALAARSAAYRPVLSRIVIAFAVFALISLLASITGVSVQRSLWSTYERMQGVIDLAHWLAFILVLTSLFRTREDWRFLLNFNLLVGLVMALMGAALIFGWQLPVYGFLEKGQRISITLGNPTYLGAYMLVNALIGAGLLVSSFTGETARRESGAAPASRRRRGRRSRRGRAREGPSLLWPRLYWGAAVSLSLWMMWESGTRSSVVALAVALAALAAAYLLWGRLKRVKLAAAAIPVCIVLFGLFLVWGAETPPGQLLAERSHTMKRLMQTAGDRDISTGGRLSSAYFGLEAFAERPLLGWGPENYIVAWGRHYDPERAGPDTGELFDLAHVTPINELATKGAVGFAGYLSLWLLLLWAVVSRLRRLGADGDTLTMFLGAALAGYFIHSVALFDTLATFMQFALLLGFMASLDANRDGSGGSGLGKGRATAAALDRLRQLTARAARFPYAGWAGAAVLAAVLGTAIYLGNIRAYQAASEARLAEAAESTAGWPARLHHHQRAITLFPPLANGPREVLLTNILRDWETLTQDREAFAEAMRMVSRAAEDLTESEPEYWNGYVRLALVYQNAAYLDPKHLAAAESYLETAEGLAPNHPHVTILRMRQSEVQEALGASPAR